MASKLTCERILATVDWAHAVLYEHELATGYQVDELLTTGRRAGAPRVKTEAPPPGKFARYLRGSCVPSREVIEQLDTRGGLAPARFGHPIYEVLRTGVSRYSKYPESFDVEYALHEVERWLPNKLTRIVDLGWAYERKPPTPRRALDLAVHGNSYALAALLAQTMELHSLEEDPLSTAQRAFQCMVLTFARGEFASTWPMMAVRIRQQVLDAVHFEGLALDTASVDLRAAVEACRKAIPLGPWDGVALRPSQQRQWLRAWLSQQDDPTVALMTPKRVTVEEALAARAQRPVALRMESGPLGRHGHVRDFGGRAQAELAAALRGYVV